MSRTRSRCPRQTQNYTSDEFNELSSSDLPNENTTEVNVTSQQLDQLQSAGEETVALAPTRVDEGGGTNEIGAGYDITFDTAREVFLQHKSPDGTIVRGRGDMERMWLKFKINTEQLLSLAIQYGSQRAYYALPIVTTSSELGTAVDRTVFVDAWKILNFSLIQKRETSYLLVEHPDGGPLPNDSLSSYRIRGKYNDYPSNRYKMEGDYPYYDVPTGDWAFSPAVGWSTLKRMIVDGTGAATIRSKIKTDGGSEEHPDWFNATLPEGIHTDYRSLLIRRYGLYAYAKGDAFNYDGEKSIRETIVDWFSERILTGFTDDERGALQSDGVSVFDAEYGPEEVPDDSAYSSRREFLKEALHGFQNARDPLGRTLSDTGRLIYQTAEQ
jgi:hypothetical protein